MPFQKKTIVTTSWDDGHKLDLKLKDFLDKYHIQGTFYPTPYYLFPLTEDELRIIDKDHEIGAHTLNHPVLTEIPKDTAFEEIVGSKKYLEEILGHPVKMFCYPFGKYNNEVKDQVKKAGYIAARTCLHGDFNQKEDPYEWHITLHASNGSPRVTYNTCRKNHLPLRALFDWEIRAKLLFDQVVHNGGVFHLWGHSWEIEQKNEWEKLDRVFSYIGNRKDVRYVTNSTVFLENI
jgi:peptidoglycan-N-acetylglucosamine deacetylase